MKTQTYFAKALVYGVEMTKKVYITTKHGVNFNQRAHQGSKERMRRVRQGRAGECYVHGEQYT